MSFFAVLRKEGDLPEKSFRIIRCHINLWSLAAVWPRRRIFYLDVGLKLEATNGRVETFDLAIPAEISSYVDLTTEMTSNRQIAELIFDSPVQFGSTPGLNGSQTIKIGKQSEMLVLTAKPNVKKDDDSSEKGFTVWPVKLARPLEDGETGYLRLRFDVSNLGQTWQWQRLGFRKTGAVLDFRMSDQRSAATLASSDALRHRVMPLENVNFFSMMPAWLHGRTVNPVLKYTRVLENEAWSAYLHRRPERQGRSMLVSSWRSLAETRVNGDDDSVIAEPAVTPEKPLRIFVDYVMRRRPRPVLIATLTSFLALIAFGAVFQLPLRGWSQAVVDEVWLIAQNVWHVLAGVSAFGLLMFLLKNVKGVRWLVQWLRKLVRKYDSFVFAYRAPDHHSH